MILGLFDLLHLLPDPLGHFHTHPLVRTVYSIILSLWVSHLKQVSEYPPHPSKKLASAALLQNIYKYMYIYISISIGGHNTILLHT